MPKGPTWLRRTQKEAAIVIDGRDAATNCQIPRLAFSRKSKDQPKVGAVIVDGEGVIRSTGFTGLARNIYDDEKILADKDEKLKVICHAEQNAIYNAARLGITLGFVTGHRPSHLRPIRRRGITPDFNLEEGTLLVRRSETRGKVVERTKNKLRQKLALPPELVQVLREHIQLTEFRADSPEAKSDLLFPSETGEYHAASFLDRPFREVTEALRLGKHITPRAMRRTFQDLMRAAEVKDIVTRSISGHLTEVDAGALQHGCVGRAARGDGPGDQDGRLPSWGSEEKW